MRRTFKNDFGSLVPALRAVHCVVATTTSGTLAATQLNYGLKLTKTATKTGRYTCGLIGIDGAAQDAIGLVNVMVTLTGGDDAALTDAKGTWNGDIRDIDVGAGALDGTFEIQLVDSDSRADAEATDGTVIRVTAFLTDSTAL